MNTEQNAPENQADKTAKSRKSAPKLKAVAYLRTSSMTNVGADKDSDKRQRAAIHAFAKRAGMTIVDEFADDGVSGTDALETRPGFAALLDRLESNGVRTVVVEDASRLARDLMVQELGIVAMVQRGVKVYAANGDCLTDTSDPMRTAMRQIAGAFAQLEKSRLVAKLASGRAQRAAQGLRPSGFAPINETQPEVVNEAKRLRRKSPLNGEQLSFRDIGAKLADKGMVSRTDKPFSASAVKRMCDGPKGKVK